jgi:HK97 family phage prohead protease
MPNSNKTETKDFKFTLADSDDDNGVFHGYASVWDVVDSYGDSVQKGAFKKTLKDKKVFPMLWSHKVDDPIGTITGTEDDHGLAVEGILNLDVQRGREVRALIKQGAINGLSIGYQTKREEVDKESGTRKLKEIALWEISPVVFPALDATEITDCKNAEFDTDNDSKADAEEPAKATPAAEPPADTGKPEEHLHLLEEFRVKALELKNLIEGVSR